MGDYGLLNKRRQSILTSMQIVSELAVNPNVQESMNDTDDNHSTTPTQFLPNDIIVRIVQYLLVPRIQMLHQIVRNQILLIVCGTFNLHQVLGSVFHLIYGLAR